MPLSLLIRRVLAILLLGVLLQHWRMVPMTFTSTSVILTTVVALLLTLLVASIVGLLRRTTWGFYAVYALVPVSTILHGVALVPFATQILPLRARPAAVLVLNVAVLLTAVWAHVLHRRRTGAGPLAT